MIDNKIPYIQGVIERVVDEAIYAPGSEFTPDLIKDADALIIRTRTICNRQLLEGSKVRFIATATIGYDHIDVDYCRQAGIAWENCPGANANSVAEYIESCLTLLWTEKKLPLEKMTMGIVGVGHVGSLVADKAVTFGMKVLENDPPRQDNEGDPHFVALKELAEKCDIISFHTPLTMTGEYKTFHLADETFFRSLRKKPVIINTSRGEVIDTKALLRAMDEGWVSDAIIDVWENEPHIDPELLKRAYIATPHIAGYSGDGKGNATRMAVEALCRHFDIKADIKVKVPNLRITSKLLFENYNDIVLIAYNPKHDSKRLKATPAMFESFRNNYPLRRETELYYKAWDKFIKGQSARKDSSKRNLARFKS